MQTRQNNDTDQNKSRALVHIRSDKVSRTIQASRRVSRALQQRCVRTGMYKGGRGQWRVRYTHAMQQRRGPARCVRRVRRPRITRCDALGLPSTCMHHFFCIDKIKRMLGILVCIVTAIVLLVCISIQVYTPDPGSSTRTRPLHTDPDEDAVTAPLLREETPERDDSEGGAMPCHRRDIEHEDQPTTTQSGHGRARTELTPPVASMSERVAQMSMTRTRNPDANGYMDAMSAQVSAMRTECAKPDPYIKFYYKKNIGDQTE